jgi:hypothetical protein
LFKALDPGFKDIVLLAGGANFAWHSISGFTASEQDTNY